MTDTARWKSTVYVGGLAPVVTAGNLHDAFIPFGEIADISLPKNENPHGNNNNNRRNDRNNNHNDDRYNTLNGEPSLHRGFAYIEFEDPEDAKEAIDNMDQSELFGRVIKVSAAKVPKSATQNQGLGSKTALWEQEGWLAENAVSEEDRLATEQAQQSTRPDDPMQGLEGLDVAGPKPE